MLGALRRWNSAATRLFRSCLMTVKETAAFCAVIVKSVRINSISLNRGGMEYREECIEECVEGASAVAEGELGGGVELGHGLVVLRKIEEGVVAEAVGSARGSEDFAFYGAVAGAKDLAVAGRGEDAVVAGL